MKFCLNDKKPVHEKISVTRQINNDQNELFPLPYSVTHPPEGKIVAYSIKCVTEVKFCLKIMKFVPNFENWFYRVLLITSRGTGYTKIDTLTTSQKFPT